ncbi:hypothetical protein [Arthrobacter sp. N199823]|uniref:hypothetical protein n=1 Tax=Arthrobacter sp. N199823 TaxID=2058895 RepID=UPI0011B09C9C|nr:hypothetical protein [Arthrobacter sp. N199823]
MSTGMQGLDPADCRELVKILKKSAAQLEQAGASLGHTVARTGWHGPDSQRFRAQWPANRKRLSTTARELEDAATQLLREIAEQERASAVDTGGGGSLWDDIVDAGRDLWDDVTDGVGNVVDGVHDAADNVVNAVEDGLSWIAQQIDFSAINKAATTGAGHLSHFLGMAGQWLDGNPPSLAGIVASAGLVLGSSFSTGVSVLTGGHVNLNLFEDGQPYAGEPQPVSDSSDHQLQLPNSISSIFGGVEDAYNVAGTPGTPDGDVRVVSVEQPDGSMAYIVNIPGTETWGINGSGQGRDLTSNLMVMAGQSSSAQRAIELAMQQAGIPPGAPVLLAGHSQGGMIAAALASDPGFMDRYNVTNVVTVGSPVNGVDIDPRVHVLEAQHQGDLVPKLDLGGLDTNFNMPGTPPNVTVVTMDDPPRDALGNILHYAPSPIGNLVQDVRDVSTNHATDLYKNDLANTSKYPGIGSYEQDPSMDVFLSNDPDRVSAVDIPVGRR